MTDLTLFDFHLRERIRLAPPGAVILVETEGERRNAEALLKFYGRDDLTLKFEPREDYDGDRFIIDLDY